MIADISVVMQGDTALVDDGAVLHTFTDLAKMRSFVYTWKALRKQFPSAEFTLSDNAAILSWSDAAAQPDPVAVRDAYIAAQDQAWQQEQTDAAALRQKILTVAGSAVGLSIDVLTAAQTRSLVACLLYKVRALDKSGVVQPLNTWL